MKKFEYKARNGKRVEVMADEMEITRGGILKFYIFSASSGLELARVINAKSWVDARLCDA